MFGLARLKRSSSQHRARRLEGAAKYFRWGAEQYAALRSFKQALRSLEEAGNRAEENAALLRLIHPKTTAEHNAAWPRLQADDAALLSLQENAVSAASFRKRAAEDSWARSLEEALKDCKLTPEQYALNIA
ncbi:hypothetical protein N9L68_08930 [bacterium]|nr:hypothetical protein [bacterium]